MYDRKIMCNGVLMVCLNSLASANYEQPFISDTYCACADALKSTQPLYRLMLIHTTIVQTQVEFVDFHRRVETNS